MKQEPQILTSVTARIGVALRNRLEISASRLPPELYQLLSRLDQTPSSDLECYQENCAADRPRSNKPRRG